MTKHVPIETRDFPVAVIASLSSGVLLCDFGKMHEAAEFLMGHPIWTHHFADKGLWGEMKKTIAAQCPGIPEDLSDVNPGNFQAKVAELESQFGEMVTIRRGGGLTAMLPTDGIPEGKKVIAIQVGKGPA